MQALHTDIIIMGCALGVAASCALFLVALVFCGIDKTIENRLKTILTKGKR